METYGGDEAVCAGSQQVPCAADLQVAHRHRETRSQVGMLRDGVQPLAAFLGGGALRVAEKISIRALSAAADAAAQLVELRQTAGVGAVNDERIGVGDIEA